MDRANRLPAEAVVAERPAVARNEVETPRVAVVVVPVRDGRPIGAERTDIAELRPIADASAGEEDTV